MVFWHRPIGRLTKYKREGETGFLDGQHLDISVYTAFVYL